MTSLPTSSSRPADPLPDDRAVVGDELQVEARASRMQALQSQADAWPMSRSRRRNAK